MRFAVTLVVQCAFGAACGCAGNTTPPPASATKTEEQGVPAPKPFLAGFAGLASGGEQKGAPDRPAEVRLIPVVVIRVEPQVKDSVPFALTNSSKEPIVYCPFHRHGLARLEGKLFQNGKEVAPQILLKHPEADVDKRLIRKLQPGETVVLDYTLPFVELKPGRYELHLKYEVAPKSTYVTEFGLTPMKLELTILLDVRKE